MAAAGGNDKAPVELGDPKVAFGEPPKEAEEVPAGFTAIDPMEWRNMLVEAFLSEYWKLGTARKNPVTPDELARLRSRLDREFNDGLSCSPGKIEEYDDAKLLRWKIWGSKIIIPSDELQSHLESQRNTAAVINDDETGNKTDNPLKHRLNAEKVRGFSVRRYQNLIAQSLGAVGGGGKTTREKDRSKDPVLGDPVLGPTNPDVIHNEGGEGMATGNGAKMWWQRNGSIVLSVLLFLLGFASGWVMKPSTEIEK